MMKLLAVSDLHVEAETNRQLVLDIPPQREDWLILAGDVGSRSAQVRNTLALLSGKFRQLVWVPGNHELWTLPRMDESAGEQRYLELVAMCREYGVLTPEDPYPTWEGEGGPVVLAPLFLLYDYSFRDEESKQDALDAAFAEGVVCSDEYLLHPDPYSSRELWCQARIQITERRLAAIPAEMATVLVSHFPLRRDVICLPRIPRFELWCGTRATEDWHVRYRAKVVVYGHLHTPSTCWRNGSRFEEVSLGYRHQWRSRVRDRGCLRQVLPASC
jgi:predicted phosphodiesterase